jgi:histidinol-phosphatase
MNAAAESRYHFAVTATQQAGEVAKRYFPDTCSDEFARFVEWKPDSSPVTVADREAEAFLRKTLLTEFPDDGFLGEESGEATSRSGFVWVIDPIDGTRSFVRGIPLWATLVGLLHEGESVAGVVVEPSLGNIYRAIRGGGAFKNDRRIRVSQVNNLKDSILATCDVNFFNQAGCPQVYFEMARRVQRQRGYGDYFGFVLVAQGSCDAMLDYGVHPWDVAALIPIVQEAGGRFTDWDGAARLDRPDVLASNGRVHDEALAVVRAARSQN